MAVVLVGSVARNTATSESDLDLLVVSDEGLTPAQAADGLHVQMFTTAQFMDGLIAGDDFPAWCVRFGVLVLDAPPWTRVVASPAAKTWPKWEAKVAHVFRRLRMAHELDLTGDSEAVREELVYAASHVGRALLLKQGIFPLSRPEMVVQLKEAAYPALAKMLDALVSPERTVSAHQAMQYVKKLLIYLDKAQYQNLLDRRRAIAKQKKRPA
jgi:hypothetical protein